MLERGRRWPTGPDADVLDGALIPGSTAACNPSMTIAAVAERAMDRIVRDDVAASDLGALARPD